MVLTLIPTSARANVLVPHLADLSPQVEAAPSGKLSLTAPVCGGPSGLTGPQQSQDPRRRC